MDLPLLAETLTIFLAPALPFLLGLGQKAAEEASKKLGGDVWAKSKEIWAKLQPAVDGKEAAREAAADLAEASDDERRRSALSRQLEKLLEADPDLARTMTDLLPESERGTVYRAELRGDGAIAQGPKARAAGKGGVVADQVSGDVIVGGRTAPEEGGSDGGEG